MDGKNNISDIFLFVVGVWEIRVWQHSTQIQSSSAWKRKTATGGDSAGAHGYLQSSAAPWLSWEERGERPWGDRVVPCPAPTFFLARQGRDCGGRPAYSVHSSRLIYLDGPAAKTKYRPNTTVPQALQHQQSLGRELDDIWLGVLKILRLAQKHFLGTVQRF